jgi:hypothetical protein
MNILITHSHAASAQRWREEIERRLSKASVKVWSQLGRYGYWLVTIDRTF